MVSSSGVSWHALRAVRSELAEKDTSLADTDQALAGLLAEAFAAAKNSIRRMDSIVSDVTAAAEHGEADSWFVLAKHRDAIAIITEANSLAAAKTVELQHIAGSYRRLSGV